MAWVFTIFGGRGRRPNRRGDRLAAEWRAAQRRLADWQRDAMRRTARFYARGLRRELRRAAPVRTGALRHSIRVRAAMRRRRLAFTVRYRMLFYGFLLNGRSYRGWIDDQVARRTRKASAFFLDTLKATSGRLRR